jgi:hypothetical protein
MRRGEDDKKEEETGGAEGPDFWLTDFGSGLVDAGKCEVCFALKAGHVSQ